MANEKASVTDKIFQQLKEIGTVVETNVHIEGLERAPGVRSATPTETAAINRERSTPNEEHRLGFRQFGILSLREVVETEYKQNVPLVAHLLSPGETALLIARQKEGKSTLALQLAIDIGSGSSFLGRYDTQPGVVLYIDYENRPHRLRERALDIRDGRPLENVLIKAFPHIAERDVALFGNKFDRLLRLVETIRPALLIIDPLRLAVEGSNSSESAAMEAIEKISALMSCNPDMAVLLIHHLRKADENDATELRKDPRAWIERVHGSQALLAHVETIWGLEHDENGYAFGTVPRSEQSFVIGLDKEEDSQRFRLSDSPFQLANLTPALRSAWDALPPDFSPSDGAKLGIANNTFYRLIHQARSMGILKQDPRTKRYHKNID